MQERTHARRRHPKPGGVRPLNLTSILDVTFLLLIFFILTATFTVDEGALATDLPGNGPDIGDVELQPDILRIEIDTTAAGLQVRFHSPTGIVAADSQAEVYRLLSTWRFNPNTNPNGWMSPKSAIIIAPTKRASWDDVVGVFNAAIRARMTDVSFAPAQ